MSRRQSLDRPGILSPPGPFLTPSPSPSISASPRLQPSPSLSPFPQDVLLVASNTITNNTHDQERKSTTPGRRQSLHQFTNGSPNAGTVLFQPSPSQSPAAVTNVVGVTAGVGGAAIAVTAPATGNEFNTTLVGSNNIQLNKKGNKRTTHQQQQQLQLQNQLTQQINHQIFSSAVSSTTCQTATSISNSVAGGYGQPHATAFNTSANSFATTNVAGCPKGQAKKGATTVIPSSTSLNQQQQQQFQQNNHYHSSSPLIADSPIPSPSNTITAAATIKPSTPQPMQMLQQQFTITGSAPHPSNQAQQVFQIIQGPQGQIVAAPAGQQHTLQQRLIGGTATHLVPTSYGGSLNSTTTSPATTTTIKSTKGPQQILPKPQQQNCNDQNQQHQQTLSHQQQQQQQQHQQQQQKSKIGGGGGSGNANTATIHTTNNLVQMPQISQSPQPQQAQLNVSATTNSGGNAQQQQILLPNGATASLTTQQPLLLNQMPVLVQQNTPQGVQLILRPPTPQLTATPSLVIQNARPQAQLQHHHQQPQQQLLRILGANGATMQLAAATPTFIVSSQANLIQQTANHIQSIKTNSQNQAITQLSGLHAALSASNQQRSHQPFTTTATINTSHLLGPSMAAQLQNLQLAAAAANGGSITQIQMPNGSTPSTTTILSQLPAQFQQTLNNAGTAGGGSLINFNQLSGANIQQLAAAAAAAGATFQTPPPPPQQQAAPQNAGTSTNTGATNIDLYNAQQASQTAEPLRRQPTPTQLQNMSGAAITINQQQQQQLSNGLLNTNAGGNTTIQIQQQQQQSAQPMSEPKKKAKPRKKKPAGGNAAAATISTTSSLAAVQSSAITTTTTPSPTLQAKNSSNLVTNTSTANTVTNKFNIYTSMSNTAPGTPQLQFSQTSPQHLKVTFSNNSNGSVQSLVNQAPQQQQQQPDQARPKLDLGNVMKLCGIMEDDDDMDEDYIDTMSTHDDSACTSGTTTQQTLAPPPGTSLTSTTSSATPANSNDIMISIPNQNGTDSMPFTVTIPASAALSAPSNSAYGGGNDTREPHNFYIKIDQNDTHSTPYTISIPRLPTAEEIQQQAQQHLAQQAAAAAAAASQQSSNNKTVPPPPPTMSFNLTPARNLSQLQPIQQQQQQLQTQLFNISAANNGGISLQLPTSSSNNNPTITITTPATTTTTTTTATVKPRRKPAVRRNGKKQDNISPSAAAVTPPTASACSTSAPASITTSTTTTNSISLMPSLRTTITTPTSAPSATQSQLQHSSSISTQASNNSAASTATTTSLSTTISGAPQVPSQIGNIQISQVDGTKMLPNHNGGGAVENKIQIMPILDSSSGGNGVNNKLMPHSTTSQYQTQQTQQQQAQPQQHQQQQQQQQLPLSHSQPNAQQNHETPASSIKLTSDGRQVQLVAMPQISSGSTTTTSSSNQTATPLVQQQPTNSMATSNSNGNNNNNSNNNMTATTTTATVSNNTTTILPPQLTGMPNNVSISVGSPATAAALIPQLTGSLTLAVSEHCERLILRHDPNQPQDQQSQIILQALLKGALPNLTIINEPSKVVDDRSSSGGGNINSNNNSSGDNNQQNIRPTLIGGLNTTTMQQVQLPVTSMNSAPQQQQQSKAVITTPNAGAINKVSIPAHLATSIATKTPTIQLQFNATQGTMTAVGSGGPTLQFQLPQQSPQQQQQQQQMQQQQQIHQQQQQAMANAVRVSEQLMQQQQQQMQQKQQQQPQQQPMLPQLTQALPPPLPPAGANSMLGSATQQQQQRYVSLPKINAATQQIFSLNSETNQITPISPTQTAASIGPTERLLIAPAGINAQQLAQCLQLGQIHFNDVNPLPPSTQPQPTLMSIGAGLSGVQQTGQQQQMQLQQQAMQQQQQRSQPPQQQIVHPQPIQPLNTSTGTSGVNTNNSNATINAISNTTTTTKQVANVAPIIDQSKAKLEPAKSVTPTGAVAKKKPVRKPKATTTAADVASGTAGIKNASVVKPMPKLDPLSQKPNNNPVQIVQPNVASGKQVGGGPNAVAGASSNNSIQPFQTLQQTTTTKLVGVTAPMQQVVAAAPAATNSQQQQVINMQEQPSQQQQQQTHLPQQSPLTSNAPSVMQSPQIRSSFAINTSTTTTSNSNVISTASTNSSVSTMSAASNFSGACSEPPSLSALNSSSNVGVAQQQALPQQQQQQQQMQSATGVQQQPQPQQQQHTVSRVQTIQLTAQQQQMFKQVQMQIQFLTIKLQHKTLLTTLPLPPDFDPAAIAAYSKPMSDAEINMALQRLYTEQQCILAAGKEMPTPEAYLQMPPVGSGAGITLMSAQLPQLPQPQPAAGAAGKVNASGIPANVVQPNNHSSTMTGTQAVPNTISSGQQAQGQTPAGVTHRIHIYPMQHHQTVQQNKQQQQLLQQQAKVQQSTLASRVKDNPNAKSRLTTQAAQQQAAQHSNSINTMSTLAPLSSQRQQQQQPTLVPTTTKTQVLHFSQQHQQQVPPQQQFNMLQKPPLVSAAQLMNGPPPLVFSSSPLIAAAPATTTIAHTSTTTNFASVTNSFVQQQHHQTLQQLHTFSQSSAISLATLTTNTSTSTTSTIISKSSSISNSSSNSNNALLIVATAASTSISSSVSNINLTAPSASTTPTTAASAPIVTTTSIQVAATAAAVAANTKALNMQAQTPSLVTAAASYNFSNGSSSTNNVYSTASTTSITATATTTTTTNAIMPPTTLTTHLLKTEECLQLSPQPQPKLARLSLFLRQLELDQQKCLNPDYLNPFEDKEEAVKRLIRYHCMYESVDDLPFEDEERFEHVALQYQEKYHTISTKYQKILLQESTLAHRTSETCQIQQLMIDDLRTEMEQMRNTQRELALCDQEPKKDTNEYIKLENILEVKPPTEIEIGKVKEDLKPMNHIKDEQESSNDKILSNLNNTHNSLDVKTEPTDKISTNRTEIAFSVAQDKFNLLTQSEIKDEQNNAAEKEKAQLYQEQSSNKGDKTDWHNVESTASATSYVKSKSESLESTDGAKGKLPASNFYSGGNKQLNGTIKIDVAQPQKAFVKKEFENFDIESEITPSFIMKKVEHKEVAQSSPTAGATQNISSTKTSIKQQAKEKSENNNKHEQQHKQLQQQQQREPQQAQPQQLSQHQLLQHKTAKTTPSYNTFEAQYLQHNSKQQQLQQQQQQQEDEWLCLQKELSLITAENKLHAQQQRNRLQQQQPNESLNIHESSPPSNESGSSVGTVNSAHSGQLIDLFPNGCIDKSQQMSPSSSSNDSIYHQQQQNYVSSTEEQQQQHHRRNNDQEHNHQQQQQQDGHDTHNHMQSSLNEFFDSGDDMADVHKSVETRLEAMFGESPVHLSKSESSDANDIEAKLDEIFGDAESNQDNIDSVKTKQQQQQQQQGQHQQQQRLWDSELAAANNFIRVASTQENAVALFANEQQQEMQLNHQQQQHVQQSLQLNMPNSATRWMQNIDDAPFSEFISNAAADDCDVSRKRRWNDELMSADADDTLDGGAKKICRMSGSSSSSSPIATQQQHHQHHDPHHQQSQQHHESILEADLLSLHDGIRVEPAAAQMLQQQVSFCQQQQFSNLLDNVDHQAHFVNAQQQLQHSMQQQHMQLNLHHHQQQQQQQLHSHLQTHMHNNHHHIGGGGGGGGDFDDDISRHVQNAIDSILNLQNSESADSLNFSLDHSMGSLLGDSILDDRQQQQVAVNCHDGMVKRRNHLVDELSDCLISGGGSGQAAGDNATHILLDSAQHHHAQQLQSALLNHNQVLQQQSQINHQQQQPSMLGTDFGCVAAGLVDEAVKSIMTS